MWVCTPFGILMPALRPEKTIEAGDDRKIQVRARHREYLDLFRDNYCADLGESINFPDQDYQWKAYCTHDALALAMARLSLEIDYVKFKPTTFKSGLPAKLADQLHSCYNSIWGTMLTHGDKTSVYDKSWSTTGGYYDPKTYKPDPTLCARSGHWYPKKRKTCVDCGHSKKCKGCERCAKSFKAPTGPKEPWAGYKGGIATYPSGISQPSPASQASAGMVPAQPAPTAGSGWPLDPSITFGAQEEYDEEYNWAVMTEDERDVALAAAENRDA